MTPVIPETETTESAAIGETARTVISFLLFVHCFCVVVVLSSNYVQSPLQQRLVTLVAPYTQSLNFDPDFTRFHLTHAAEEHDDHVIEVTLPDAPDQPLMRLPDVGWRGGDRYKRYQRLASAMAFAANREFDSVSGQYARAIGDRVMAEREATRVVVRCYRLPARALQEDGLGLEDPPGPRDRSQYQSIYEADVWIADDSTIQVLKKSSRREVAPNVNKAP